MISFPPHKIKLPCLTYMPSVIDCTCWMFASCRKIGEIGNTRVLCNLRLDFLIILTPWCWYWKVYKCIIETLHDFYCFLPLHSSHAPELSFKDVIAMHWGSLCVPFAYSVLRRLTDLQRPIAELQLKVKCGVMIGVCWWTVGIYVMKESARWFLWNMFLDVAGVR